MDLNSIYVAENTKRRADGMTPLSVEQFIEDVAFDMCWWMIRHQPEEILDEV